MKRIFVILFALLPMLMYAGVIMKKSGDRIDNVSIKSVTDTEIIYTTGSGKKASVLKSEVSAVLYDDGRYEEIRQNENPASDSNTEVAREAYTPAELSPEAKEYNVCAYGVYAMFYVPNSKYDGATVEYRVIYKGQKETPEFKYLGTTPFAYLTEKMYENNFTAKGDPNFQKLKELNPLIIENDKDVKKILKNKEKSMKVNLKIIKEKEKEFFSTLMEINMKVILKMIIMKDKGNIFMQMGIYMKANFLMIVFMEKEHLYTLMEINMWVIGKMI